MRWKWMVGLVAGFVMGIVFVVACNDARRGRDDGGGPGLFDAGGDAHAQAGSCGRWEVARYILAGGDGPVVGELDDGEPIYAVPAGWEPFAWDSPNYALRRCAD